MRLLGILYSYEKVESFLAELRKNFGGCFLPELEMILDSSQEYRECKEHITPNLTMYPEIRGYNRYVDYWVKDSEGKFYCIGGKSGTPMRWDLNGVKKGVRICIPKNK